MTEKCKRELQQATTLNEVISVVNKHYDLDKPLGPIGKITVLGGMDKIITIIGAKPR